MCGTFGFALKKPIAMENVLRLLENLEAHQYPDEPGPVWRLRSRNCGSSRKRRGPSALSFLHVERTRVLLHFLHKGETKGFACLDKLSG